VTPSTLVGRDDERTGLADALTRCRSGRGGLVLVSGEAGVGKSRLVAEALRGWDGRHGSAMAVPGSAAYAVLARAVQKVGSAGGEVDVDAWQADPAGTIPRALCAIARDGPAVLVLDDLHLADSATIDVLATVAEAVATEPALVVGVYRSDGLARGHPIRGLRTELRRADRLLDIALRPFDQEQTGALLAALLGATPSAGLVAAVQQCTDGLPFFVEELTTALLQGNRLRERSGVVDLAADAVLPVPETVTDAVLARTAELRREHGSAVEWAVVLGVQVDLPALAALAGSAAVDSLIEAGLLVEFDAGTAVFRHALIRDALHRSIPWGRRRRLHQSVAEFLEASAASPAIVAEHWIAASEPARARPLLLAAAAQHRAAHAYRDASALAGRAVALWPDGEDPAGWAAAAETFAACTELSGDAGAAAAIWTDVAHRCAAAGHPERAGRAHARAANAAVLSGDLVGTALARAAAADALVQAGALSDAAEQRLALGAQLRSAGRLTEALEQATEATELAERSGRRDVQAHALALEGAVRAALGQRRGVALARAGLEMALSVEVTGVAAEAQYALAEALEFTADYAAAVNAYESAFELCRTEGLGEFASICFVCMSPASRLMGQWDRTLAICTEVLADGDATVLAHRVAEEESGLITALRGDHRRARGPLRRAAEFGRAQGIFGLEVGATWGLVVVHDLAEDDAAARATAARLLERCGATEECHYALPALRWTASFLADHDDVPALAACHRLVGSLATRSGSAKVLSALAHVGAELALAEGDAAAAGGQFARSVDLLAGITAPFDRALTQLRRGVSSVAAGDRETAVAALTDAYRCARNLGARPLARRCATALAEMGEPVDRRIGRLGARAAQLSTLTGRERDVLLRLAEGRTNREIAGELFLSTRTVDMHVRNVFTKLGCSSRTAAVRRAAEQGVIPAGR
jgi:DNA-binding CsgD family transcriptional regulator